LASLARRGREPFPLARGVPDPELLPVDEIAACSRTVLDRAAPTVLSYGAAAGDPALRAGVAERHDLDARRVLVSNGSLQGLALVAAHMLAGDRRRVVRDAPPYDPTL